MGYQALYRRYRPAFFEDFVGQEAVIRTLRSQVMSGRIAHAYLFNGTRGTGKTSAAKVLARAINCESPRNGDPCGECAACRALSGENSMDILEIDAASNNGVDQIRELRDQVNYPPQVGRYRVYIIDEVHMLSAGAFNALLKTLEEPPAHVVFILATTEPQKLPATILSRCQRFDFHRIASEQIVARLRVALEEGQISAEPAALARIARSAEGGMRDAWSIMDQCLGYAQEEGAGLTEALVIEVLGASDKSFLFSFADALIASDMPSVLRMINEMMIRGREVQVFVRDVSAHIRSLLLAKVAGASDAAHLLDVTAEDAGAYCEQADRVSSERLMRMLDLFLSAESDMKWHSQPRYALEETALRACAPEESLRLESLLERVDELERKLKEGVVVQAASEKKTPRSAAAKSSAPVAPDPAPAGADPQAEAIWQAALKALRAQPPVWSLLRTGRLSGADGGLFTVLFEQGTGGAYVGMLNSETKKAVIEAELTKAAGYACRFRAAVEGKQDNTEQKQNNLNTIFEAFGRENVRVLEETK